MTNSTKPQDLGELIRDLLETRPQEWDSLDEEGKRNYLLKEGYLQADPMPDGNWKGITKLAYTTAICLGIDAVGLTYRFCFEDPVLCLIEYQKLNNINDIPAGWIACRPQDRFPNPCFFDKENPYVEMPKDTFREHRGRLVWDKPQYTEG